MLKEIFSVESGYDFSDLRVLVCDDSRQIRSLISSFLVGFGVKDAAEALDADDAFAKLIEYDPDLVITDWNMPPTDGLEFVQRVRNSEESPNPYVPIIMLTGYTELHRVKMARDSGISAFLAKPISAQALYKRLVSVVDDQRPFVRNDKFFGPCRRGGRRTNYPGAERRKQAQ